MNKHTRIAETCRAWHNGPRSAMFQAAAGLEFSMAKLVGECKRALAQRIHVEGGEADLRDLLTWAELCLKVERTEARAHKANEELKAALAALSAWAKG